MREKRKAGTHKAATHPYGQQRNTIMARKQAAYGAAPQATEPAKPKRKRAPKKSPRATEKSSPDGHGDVPLPDASSPESEKQGSPEAKQPCVADAGPSGEGAGRRGRASRARVVLPSSIVDARVG